MSDLLNEQLSALLDGELPPEETTLLLRRLRREPALAEQLARYRLCGEVLRGERVQARPDFAMRVSAAIAEEPAFAAAPAARRRTPQPRWLRAAGGFSVAAAVAAVAVLVLRHSPVLSPPAQPMATVTIGQPTAATVAPAAMDAVSTLAPAATQALASRAAERSTEPVIYVTPPVRSGLGEIPPASLAHYVVAHSEVSSPLARSSVLTSLVAAPRAPENAPVDANAR
jgi:negative regulator of sigma E activity